MARLWKDTREGRPSGSYLVGGVQFEGGVAETGNSITKGTAALFAALRIEELVPPAETDHVETDTGSPETDTDPAEVDTEPDLTALSGPELKSIAKDLGVATSGTKVELVERILEAQQTAGAE